MRYNTEDCAFRSDVDQPAKLPSPKLEPIRATQTSDLYRIQPGRIAPSLIEQPVNQLGGEGNKSDRAEEAEQQNADMNYELAPIEKNYKLQIIMHPIHFHMIISSGLTVVLGVLFTVFLVSLGGVRRFREFEVQALRYGV